MRGRPAEGKVCGVAADVERTGDGRWILAGGRRWRATDPSIPEGFRQELVDHLMEARRAVGRARTADTVAAARREVQAAKVALGERGEPWWERPTEEGRRARIEAAILALAGHRGPDKTICPSDAARAIGGDSWRSVMPAAQDVARALARVGEVEVSQKGGVLDPAEPWKGPIRIRRR